MSINDETWDREQDIRRNFDPDSMENWLKYHSTQDFLAIMIHELRREKEIIEKWAELLNDNPQLQSTTLNLNGQAIPVTFCTETILKATRILNRLLDTAAAYREQAFKD